MVGTLPRAPLRGRCTHVQLQVLGNVVQLQVLGG